MSDLDITNEDKLTPDPVEDYSVLEQPVVAPPVLDDSITQMNKRERLELAGRITQGIVSNLRWQPGTLTDAECQNIAADAMRITVQLMRVLSEQA